MSRDNKSWDDQENERLKALVSSGASAGRASIALKRTILSVQIQARKLGTPFPDIREERRKRRKISQTPTGRP
jgi:hypothetical protein